MGDIMNFGGNLQELGVLLDNLPAHDDREDINHRVFALHHGWEFPLYGAALTDYEAAGSPRYGECIDDALAFAADAMPDIPCQLSTTLVSALGQATKSEEWVFTICDDAGKGWASRAHQAPIAIIRAAVSHLLRNPQNCSW